MADPQDFWFSGRPLRRVRGYVQCRHALTDARLTSDPYTAGVTDHPSHNLLMMSGAAHETLRMLVAPFFSRAAAAELAPHLIAARDGLLRKVLAADSADLVADLLEPLVCEATVRSVGIAEPRAEIALLLRPMLGLLEPSQSGRSSDATGSFVRVAALLNRRTRAGRSDELVQRLLDAHANNRISREDAAFTVPVILHGGYENPLNYLGSLLATAVESTDRFVARARSSPDQLIEDILRQYPPARGVARWATEDVPDLRVAQGDAVWIDLESANGEIEGEQFPDAPHLSFGLGSHRCPGVHLARQLARIVVEGLLALSEENLKTAVVQRYVGVATRGVAMRPRADRHSHSSPGR